MTLDRKSKMDTSGHSPDGRTFLMSLSHLSIAAVFLIGPFTMTIPFLIWILESRRQERDTELIFQAKQAFFYQAGVFLAGILLAFLTGILTVLFVGFLLMPVNLLFGMAATLYGIWGGVRILQGAAFRYYWLGEFLET